MRFQIYVKYWGRGWVLWDISHVRERTEKQIRTLKSQTRVGSTARGREWDFHARSGRCKGSLAPELGTKVKKKDLKQRGLPHQMQTLQGCRSWSWGGHFPMTQRKSVFISFQRNCWVFLAPKELRAKVTGVKQQDFPFFFFFFGKWREKLLQRTMRSKWCQRRQGYD